ncbi:MAG: hypothetical protein OEY06_11855 [Gammaproteobacteria bacterium]|nr:hypothetical protein [Gammaproteobacteria bacterium]
MADILNDELYCQSIALMNIIQIIKLIMANKILITGSGETIGINLVCYLLQNDLELDVLCFDNNESELFILEQEHISESRVNVCLRGRATTCCRPVTVANANQYGEII